MFFFCFLHLCFNINNCTADCNHRTPCKVVTHYCACSTYLSHTLAPLLWLREATVVDFEDVAGLGQSNHRCPSEVAQSASDIAPAFEQPDWSVGASHRKTKGVFPRGGFLNSFRRTSLRTPVSSLELIYILKCN